MLADKMSIMMYDTPLRPLRPLDFSYMLGRIQYYALRFSALIYRDMCSLRLLTLSMRCKIDIVLACSVIGLKCRMLLHAIFWPRNNDGWVMKPHEFQ
jgi:hypothetical protein